MGIFKSNFEKVLDKCTSNLLLEPDWEGMLQLCDFIRGNDVKPREAVNLIKKTLENPNPHQQYFGYCTLDTVAKNCGKPVHEEIITRAFLEQQKERLQGQAPEKISEKILEMIQTWGLAGRSKAEFKLATDMYNIMKAEGYEFPTVQGDNDLIVDAAVAPVWKEGDDCFRCKSTFSVITRKHHCRACGNIFCDKCSAKSSTIPKFGIEKDVRVCDSCYSQLQAGRTPTGAAAAAAAAAAGSAAKRVTWADDQNWQDEQAAVLAKYAQHAKQKEKRNSEASQRAQEEDLRLKEQEELELAIALSLDEAEQSKVGGGKSAQTSPQPVAPSSSNSNERTSQEDDTPQLPTLQSDQDSDLQKYLDRSYWEQRNKTTENAPPPTQIPSTSAAGLIPQMDTPVEAQSEYILQNDTTPDEMASAAERQKFMKNVSVSLDIFLNRMRADQVRGKPIAIDTTVQTLFKQISEIHPKLLDYTHEAEERRTHWEHLSDKVNLISDARTALNALRDEHKQEMRRRAEEAERQRQIQLAQKLEMMRQKKREYLETQRAATLARMAENQAQLQAKRETQRALQMQKHMNQYQPNQYQPQAQYPVDYNNHYQMQDGMSNTPPSSMPISMPQMHNQPMNGAQEGHYGSPGMHQQYIPPPQMHQQQMHPPAHQQQMQHPPAQMVYQPGHPPVQHQVVDTSTLPQVPTHEPPPAEPEPVREAQLISFE